MANGKPNPVTIRHAVGAAIRGRRQILGWTQREVSEKLSVRPDVVSQYEFGDKLDIGNLYRIADALGCTVESLLPPTAEEKDDG